MSVRTLVVWCPDWPLAAAGITPEIPAAVVVAGEIAACTAAARAAGVRRGLRRREAQSRCPQLSVLAADPARDARVFEPVVAAVETVVPGVEVLRPGVCAVPSRGAARYFGGDIAVIDEVHTVVWRLCGVDCLVGVADGLFAAVLAARGGTVVPPGDSAAFLAPMPVDVLDRPDLTDLLRRLGLPTLGALARLPAEDVLARFGPDGARVHRLSRGADERPVLPRRPLPDMTVSVELDPPADRVDVAAFAARRLAEDVHDQLDAAGLACTRIVIEARTGNGEELRRVWRHDGPLTATAIADRVRWQLDGWLSGTADAPVRPTAGVVLLRLVPDEVVTAGGRQLGLWGDAGTAADRVVRALDRVQGILGPDAVATAEVGGGRGPADRVHLVSWGEPRGTATGQDQPWPGRMPSPAPATVLPEPLPAVLACADGTPVGVTGRYQVTSPPVRLSIAGRPPVEVASWAGPWAADERWWDPAAMRRRARFQVASADGPAWLLAVENGSWWVEALYD